MLFNEVSETLSFSSSTVSVLEIVDDLSMYVKVVLFCQTAGYTPSV